MPLVDLEFNIEDVKGFENLPTDKYACKCTKAELTKAASSNKPMVKFEFTVTDGEFAGRKIFDNMPLHVDFKVKMYAEGLLGLSSGAQLDTDAFLGTECVIDLLTRPLKEKEKEDAIANGKDPNGTKSEIKSITKIG